MTNIEFFNTLAMTDINMTSLHGNGIKLLLGYSKLQGDFQRIRREFPFLGNSQILRLILIEHERDTKIVQSLNILEYVAKACNGVDHYRKFLISTLHDDLCEKLIFSKRSIPEEIIIFTPYESALHFGELTLTPCRGELVARNQEGEYLGKLCTEYGLSIKDDVIQLVLHQDGEIHYRMKLGKQGLHIVHKEKSSLSSRSMFLTSYYGKISCYIDILCQRE